MPDQESTSYAASSNHSPSTPWMAYVLLLVVCFGIGIGGRYIWTNWDRINELFYTASEQKYRTMTGEAGPVTYLVYHSDFKALDQFAIQRDDVIGVEVYRYPNVSAIAIENEQSDSINSLKSLPYVEKIERRVVPMLCH